MKFTIEAAEKVVWTANEHIAYCNLPLMMVQYWSYVYELNGYLMDLVCVLSIGYRATKRLLNLLAPEYIYQKDNTEDNTPNTGKEFYHKNDHSKNEWINKGRMF